MGGVGGVESEHLEEPEQSEESEMRRRKKKGGGRTSISSAQPRRVGIRSDYMTGSAVDRLHQSSRLATVLLK